MPVKVGIPKALLYYYYYPQWITFLEALGAQVVVSGNTTRALLEKGLNATVDEACLPVKLAVGHVASLKDQVDYIFLPRLVSLMSKEYICPKFLGFPDMVRHTMENMPPLIDCNFDLYRHDGSYKFYYEVGRIFTSSAWRIKKAYHASMQALQKHRAAMESGVWLQRQLLKSQVKEKIKPVHCSPQHGDIVVAVLGHPYNLYDSYINMDLLKKLNQQGVKVVTADNLPQPVVDQKAQALPKKLFWSLNQRIIGAAYHYLQQPDVDGLIHVASFGCGPDSMSGELIDRYVSVGYHKPILNLTLDEHTGEAGMVTRLEAFVDMVRWRRNLADVAATL